METINDFLLRVPAIYNYEQLGQEKEQIIVFLYDTEYCRHEADDPQKAVLFFHPNWVSEHQRLALCGQLMGATHFCSTIFSAPSVLTLQSGKFLLKKFGQYVMSVGSDQSLPEWILKERFRALQCLIEFYHCDLDAILETVDRDHDAFIERLGQIFDLYIPILQSVVTSVGSVPSVQYTNGNSSVFLEALQLLEACSANKGVAGGVILHNSRVIVSQLDAKINLLASLTDPNRVKNCAKAISVPFHLPVGVQLFKVFVQSSLLSELNNKTSKDAGGRKKLIYKPIEHKRDVAKIFTVLEEEESWNGSQRADVLPSKESSYVKLKHRRNSKHKTENNTLKERSKNYKANPNISVCSTPTVEKKLIHDEVLSICSGKVDQKVPVAPVPDLVQDVLKSKPVSSAPLYKSLRRFSMDDQMIDLTHKAYPIPLRYYSFGLPRMVKPEKEKTLYNCKLYKTIADPMYPVFREDGVPVSKGLYNHCLNEHYKDYLAANRTIDSQEEFLKKKHLENNVKKETPETKVVEECKPVEPEKKIDQKLFRRSLTLPLKPMTLDDDSKPPSSKNKVLQGITPSTPLMTKLSILAFEENQQISEEKSVELPLPICARRREGRSQNGEVENKKKRETGDVAVWTVDSLVPCSLFVCGQGNMTLLLLIEEGEEQNPDLVLQLWEAGTSNLDRVESAWNRSLDHVTQNGGSSSSYSFLSLDPEWGTVRKHGAWGNEELRIVGSLHQDLLKSGNITELIVRSEDSVVYGYRCGSIETFYQQTGCSSVGLPTPADLMGVVTLKARRRLERDHGIVLL